MLDVVSARRARRGGGRGGRTVVAALAVTGLLAACGSADEGGEQTLPASVAPSPTRGAGTSTATSTTSSTTTSSTTTTTTVFEPRRFTLAASGDILLHTTTQQDALAHGGGSRYDFDPVFAEVAPLVSAADLALCHQETPVSADNTALSGYPVFNAPTEIAADLADAGYDGCSTASNHALDRGRAGVTATLDVFDAAGLGHVGTARSQQERDRPPIYDVGGVAVGHLSYAYGFNGIPLPADAPWLANLIDAETILTDAAALRDRGAAFVVVSLQWGAEYQAAPTADQQALAARLLGSPDVDLILGTHVHVVQPIDRIDGKYVAYGMGNFLSNQTERPPTQDGVLLQFEVTEQPDGSFAVTAVRYTPTWVEHPGSRIALASGSRYPESYRRTTEALHLLGTFDGTPTT
jgi:poly-gamma-glutamate synthesis protein (capsule biosynthesis protein)